MVGIPMPSTRQVSMVNTATNRRGWLRRPVLERGDGAELGAKRICGHATELDHLMHERVCHRANAKKMFAWYDQQPTGNN